MLPEILTPVPGPRSRELAGKLAKYEARDVTWMTDEFPVFWERAEGSNVWDADGNRFLDLTAAFAVSGLGHSATKVRDALTTQAGQLLHAMGDVHPAVGKARLCEELSAVTFERWGAGIGRTILANSGSEAVEAALKTAVMSKGKPGVIYFSGGYHGLGYGALAAGGLPYFRKPFAAQIGTFGVEVPFPGCYRCPWECREETRLEGDPFPQCSTNCLATIEQAIRTAIADHEIGCLVVEPIQGRGGEIVPPQEFLPLLRRICDEEKILLIADEIYTGFHRTGKFFACEHFGVIPDIICLGKALTNGFPLAACVGRAEVMDAWPRSQGEALHTSTMLGNPLGCAMALAAIGEHRKPETARRAGEVGRKLKAALRSLDSPHIGDVRGVGAMLGMELVRKDGRPFGELAVAMMIRALGDGLILLGGGMGGAVLSFSPPFTLSDEEIDFLIEKLQLYLRTLPVGE